MSSDDSCPCGQKDCQQEAIRERCPYYKSWNDNLSVDQASTLITIKSLTDEHNVNQNRANESPTQAAETLPIV